MAAPQTRLRKLVRRSGTLRTSQLAAEGIARVQLSRMVAAGDLKRVSRGVYALPDYQPSENAALATVAQRAPHAVLCLLTALRFHGITSQAPFEVWIAIGNKEHPPRIDNPPLRVVRFSADALTQGVETHKIDGIRVKVTNVAKTVADCFKFRNKIGLDVALEALREARSDKRVTMEELWQMAQVCRVANIMRPYLESLP